jgi:hypothetical protein
MAKLAQKTALACIMAAAVLAFGGCSMMGEPRLRVASYATPTLGTRFVDANDLGKHSYNSPLGEIDGIAYTCRGGDIDVAHVRISADYVRYLYGITRRNIIRSRSGFFFRPNDEPSKFFVRLTYPSYWKSLSRSDRAQLSDEVSLELGQYLAYNVVIWHEISTWFGYKSTGFFPEFPSAFSWEDAYSDIVGLWLGAQAVQDKEHDYDEVMTIVIKKELENLGVLSYKTARQASEKMKGKWWEGTPFVVLVDMKQRNMDIGDIDGFVTPMLIPGICPDAKPLSYPIPTLRLLPKYGFKIGLEIEPKVFEGPKILRIVYPGGDGKMIRPSVDFPIIMNYIRNEGIKMGYTVMPLKDSVPKASVKPALGARGTGF